MIRVGFVVSLLLLVVLAAATDSPAAAGSAATIPAFARRYGMSCNVCHNPVPRLTAFGEAFAGNGFRLAPGEPPRDTIATGDELLDLPRNVPLAIRLDAFVQAFSEGDATTDFETPYNLKLLSGGTLSRKLSYYLYFFLFERGEVGGVEDAFLYVNDIGGKPVDLAVGQFQVSDPMFKRELRLEFQDYAVYRARVGEQPADLTYDRGLMLSADVAGFTLTGVVVNGNGRVESQPDRRLDDDPAKNVMAHATRDLAPGVRVGGLAYAGRQDGSVGGGPEVTNDLWMLGGDATFGLGPVELNVQVVHREDDHPTFTPGEPEVVTNGGFAELILQPPGRRWYGVALYNRVDADRPLLDVRLGTPGDVRRYETLTGGAGWLLRRNVRLHGEATWDLEREEASAAFGFSTAF